MGSLHWGSLLLYSFVGFSTGTGTEGSLNLIHLYASWQMCPSDFSGFWGSELHSYHALPSWYSEEKKSNEKVGHTDGISSSPPCQPYAPSWGCLFVFSIWSERVRLLMLSARCTAAPFVHVVCNLPSALDLWPITPFPAPWGWEASLVFLWISWVSVSVSRHAFLKPLHTLPVCVMSTLECVCVCLHANGLCSGVCVCHVTGFPLAHCTAALWLERFFFCLFGFLFI